MLTKKFDLIKNHFQTGKIFAYPTEYIFGLGCDPLSKIALQKLVNLKSRSANKGFIIIASDFTQLEKYIDQNWLTPSLKQQILETKHPTTFIVKASSLVDPLISGEFQGSCAIRITKMPSLIELCQFLNSAIISTSANYSGQQPLDQASDLNNLFPELLILDQEVEFLHKAKGTTIVSLIDGLIVRP